MFSEDFTRKIAPLVYIMLPPYGLQ